MTTRLLNDMIEEHLRSARSRGLAVNTLRGRERDLRKFMAIVGNIQIKNVNDRHVDLFFERRQADGLQPSSLNLALANLKAFFKWAERAKHIPTGSNPVIDRRDFKVMPKERLRIPAHDFPRLLDAAVHPRDRIVVALSLYLFLRQSEVADLRIADVDLSGGAISVRIPKSHKLDSMPICAELDDELRLWLRFYSGLVPTEPRHYLVPAKSPAKYDRETGSFRGPTASEPFGGLRPERRMTGVHQAVQRALEGAGYPIRNEDGTSALEGNHTLRRSGARALYDSLAERGHDRAIRHVQSMLHHSSMAQTEHYIGIEPDRASRDVLLRGQRMFAQPGANVVKLVREG